jgi:hypothetical protein
VNHVTKEVKMSDSRTPGEVMEDLAKVGDSVVAGNVRRVFDPAPARETWGLDFQAAELRLRNIPPYHVLYPGSQVQIDNDLYDLDMANKGKQPPRRCLYAVCNAILQPGWPAVYCSVQCAHNDA